MVLFCLIGSQIKALIRSCKEANHLIVAVVKKSSTKTQSHVKKNRKTLIVKCVQKIHIAGGKNKFIYCVVIYSVIKLKLFIENKT